MDGADEFLQILKIFSVIMVQVRASLPFRDQKLILPDASAALLGASTNGRRDYGATVFMPAGGARVSRRGASS